MLQPPLPPPPKLSPLSGTTLIYPKTGLYGLDRGRTPNAQHTLMPKDHEPLSPTSLVVISLHPSPLTMCGRPRLVRWGEFGNQLWCVEEKAEVCPVWDAFIQSTERNPQQKDPVKGSEGLMAL